MAPGAALCNGIRHGARRIRPLVSAVKNARHISYLQLRSNKNGGSKKICSHSTTNVIIFGNEQLKNTCIQKLLRRSYSSLPDHELVRLPNLSPTMEVGTIVSWDKEEGDRIEEGEVLATIETDKSTMEMETPEEGYLAKIIVPAGAKDIPINQLIAILVSEEEDIAAFADFTSEEGISAAEAPAKPAETPTPEEPTPEPAVVEAVAPPPPPPASTTARVFASPLAKRMAMEKGVDINKVTGTGPRGRVTVEDVEAFQSPDQQVVTPAQPPPVVTPVAIQPPLAPPPPPPPPPAGARYTDIDLSNMRKTIAKRLTESKQNIPHYYLSVDVIMDEVMALRKQLNDGSDGSYKLSVNDFIIKASALALLKVPECNSQWMDSFIRQFNNVDISVAVSTEGGLITPIVADADKKGLASINQDVVRLAEKARNKTIQPHEFVGGTFSISNLGMFGITNFSAVINPPQSCILAVGATEDRLIPDASTAEGFRTAKVMSVTLSCDHRVVDGAVGATWLKSFRSFLEKPISMLL